MPRIFAKPALCLLLFTLCLGSSACALFDFWVTEDSVKLNTQAAFSECLKMCYDNGTHTRNSYSSCLDGCGRAARDYPLADDIFSDYARCEDEIRTVRGEGARTHSPNLCSDVADTRKRQGCDEGVSTFYQVIAAYSACLPVHEQSGNPLAPPNREDPASATGGSGLQGQDLAE